MIYKCVDCVEIGDVVGRNIFDAHNNLLLKKGVKIRSNILTALARHEIKELIVAKDELENVFWVSEVEVARLASTMNKFNQLANEIDIYKRSYYKKKSRKLLFDSLLKRDSMFDDIKDISSNIVISIARNKDKKVLLNKSYRMSEFVTWCNINVAIMSVHVASRYSYNVNELKDLFLGALIKDSGYYMISEVDLRKEVYLNEEEKKLLQKHVEFLKDVISDSNAISGNSKAICYQHHEYLDGSGYPFSLSSREINPLSKIVTAVDITLAMLSPRPHRKSYSKDDTFKMLEDNYKKKIDMIYALTVLEAIV